MMNIHTRNKPFANSNREFMKGVRNFEFIFAVVVFCSQITIAQAQRVATTGVEEERRALQTELSQAVDQDRSVIAAAVDSFVRTITAGEDKTTTVDAGGVIPTTDSIDAKKNTTLTTTVFVYTGDELGNPFVATGALASELGIANTLQSSDPQRNKSIEVSSVIVNRDIEEIEVLVHNPRALEPLEYFNKEALTYTGQITNKYGQPIALINGPDGLLYKAGIGDRLGRSQAQVARIEGGVVVIKIGSIEDVIPLSPLSHK